VIKCQGTVSGYIITICLLDLQEIEFTIVW